LTKRHAALIATGIAGAMVLSACGGGSSNGGSSSNNSGTPTGRSVFGEPTDWPENLMPLISAGNATSTADIEVGVFPEAYLIQPDLSLKYNSDLFTSEPTSSVSGNTQTVTYKINSKANWSDGKPINADDFKYTWNIQKSTDPAKGGCAAVLSSTGYDQVSQVAGSDNGKTVKVTVSPPFADWKSLFSGTSNPLFPAHVMDKGDPKANCDYITAGWPIAAVCRTTSPVAPGRSRSPTSTTVSRSSSRRRTRTTSGPRPRRRSWSSRVSATTRRPRSRA